MRFLRVESEDGSVYYVNLAHVTNVWFSGSGCPTYPNRPEDAEAEIGLTMPPAGQDFDRRIQVRGVERVADLRAQLDALAAHTAERAHGRAFDAAL